MFPVKCDVVKEASKCILGQPGLSTLGAKVDCPNGILELPGEEPLICNHLEADMVTHLFEVAEDQDAPYRRTVNSDLPTDALWIHEDESKGVTPFRRGNCVYLPVGKSLIIPPWSVVGLQPPFRIENVDVSLAGSGNTPANVAVIGSVRQAGMPIKAHLTNLGSTPQQMGSRCGVLAFLVPDGQRVFLRRTTGSHKEIGSREPKPTVNSLESVTDLQQAFPEVICDGLGTTRHYPTTILA